MCCHDSLAEMLNFLPHLGYRRDGFWWVHDTMPSLHEDELLNACEQVLGRLLEDYGHVEPLLKAFRNPPEAA